MKKTEIDWEQRRWDLVVQMIAAREGASTGQTVDQATIRIMIDSEHVIDTYRKYFDPPITKKLQ